jgi:RNA polymerase sigma-70 factor, ECF subfamily
LKPGEFDRDLILRLKKGDAKSFELLFHNLYPSLCTHANKFVNDIDEAEEIAQEALYKLWITRNHLDEDDSVKGYLFTAVKNAGLQFLRHKKVKDKYSAILFEVYKNQHAPTGHEILINKELENGLTSALQKLPSECRKVFELSRMKGMKYAEIASHLKISQKTVETQMSRALNKIKLQLKDYILLLVVSQL